MLSIHDVAQEGGVEQLRTAINLHPHSIDVCDKDHGRTLLHIAARRGYDVIIDLLIERGSRAIDLADNYGVTPLLAAIRSGKTTTAIKLLQLGSRAVDVHGGLCWTPMHAAMYCPDSDILVKTLMRFGCTTFDLTTRDGATPLHCAAGVGCLKSVEMLVRLGSQSLSCRNDSGRTPFYEAFTNGCMATARFLYIIEGLQHPAGPLSRITERDRWMTRRSVYFHQSLSARLFYMNDRLRHLRQNLKNKH